MKKIIVVILAAPSESYGKTSRSINEAARFDRSRVHCVGIIIRKIACLSIGDVVVIALSIVAMFGMVSHVRRHTGLMSTIDATSPTYRAERMSRTEKSVRLRGGYGSELLTKETRKGL